MVQQRKPEIAVIYEDHKFFGQAFLELLKSSGLFSEVYFYSDEKALLSVIHEHSSKACCLFIDFFLETGNALHLLTDLRRQFPSLYTIVVSSVDSAPLIQKILQQKVDGFISKVDGIEQVRECLASMARKQLYISPTVQTLLGKTQEPVRLSHELTARELEILGLLSLGKNTADIADSLHLSIHTVMTHRKNMMAKIGVSNISQAIVFAIRTGLIENC